MKKVKKSVINLGQGKGVHLSIPDSQPGMLVSSHFFSPECMSFESLPERNTDIAKQTILSPLLNCCLRYAVDIFMIFNPLKGFIHLHAHKSAVSVSCFREAYRVF